MCSFFFFFSVAPVEQSRDERLAEAQANIEDEASCLRDSKLYLANSLAVYYSNLVQELRAKAPTEASLTLA